MLHDVTCFSQSEGLISEQHNYATLILLMTSAPDGIFALQNTQTSMLSKIKRSFEIARFKPSIISFLIIDVGVEA